MNIEQGDSDDRRERRAAQSQRIRNSTEALVALAADPDALRAAILKQLEGEVDRQESSRSLGKNNAWRELTAAFSSAQRQRIANLLAHSWMVTAVEVVSKFEGDPVRIERDKKPSKVEEIVRARLQAAKPLFSAEERAKCESLSAEMGHPTQFARPVGGEVPTALARYKECGEGLEHESPLERLRFFCSLAMNGQDWLDFAPFFDDLDAQLAKSAAASKVTARQAAAALNTFTRHSQRQTDPLGAMRSALEAAKREAAGEGPSD